MNMKMRVHTHYFSMGQSSLRMETLANDFAIFHEHTANTWIRECFALHITRVQNTQMGNVIVTLTKYTERRTGHGNNTSPLRARSSARFM